VVEARVTVYVPGRSVTRYPPFAFDVTRLAAPLLRVNTIVTPAAGPLHPSSGMQIARGTLIVPRKPEFVAEVAGAANTSRTASGASFHTPEAYPAPSRC